MILSNCPFFSSMIPINYCSHSRLYYFWYQFFTLSKAIALPTFMIAMLLLTLGDFSLLLLRATFIAAVVKVG